MKLLKYIFLFGIVLCFNCDELEEILEEEIQIQINARGLMHVDSPNLGDPSDPVDLESEFVTYNFLNDPEIEELVNDQSELKKIEIQRIRYQFQNFSGNTDAVAIGQIKVVIAPSGVFQDYNTPQVHLETADNTNELYIIQGNFDAVNNFVTAFGSIGVCIYR